MFNEDKQTNPTGGHGSGLLGATNAIDDEPRRMIECKGVVAAVACLVRYRKSIRPYGRSVLLLRPTAASSIWSVVHYTNCSHTGLPSHVWVEGHLVRIRSNISVMLQAA